MDTIDILLIAGLTLALAAIVIMAEGNKDD
jgi:hypothetical protein